MTNCKNASRLFKQTASLLKNELFDEVYIVGLGEEGLAENEIISSGQKLWRIFLKSRKFGSNIVVQGIKYFEYAFRILIRYRSKSVKVVTSHGLDTLLLGVLFKWFYGAILVYDAHELETEKNGLNGIRKRLSKITERVLIRFVDEIFVVSESIVDDYKLRYGIEKPNLVMNCPNFVEVDKRQYFRERFGIHPNSIIYLYQGGLVENRGLDLMLEYFKGSNPNERVIVFMGYGVLESRIADYSSKFPAIFYHEAVPPDVVLEYTASADVGISVLVFKGETNLSYYYCLPNKFFEYLMAGLPIICSDIPEMRKILEKEKVGVMVEEHSIESFSLAIEQLEKMKFGEIRDLSQNILSEYNWEEQEKILLKVYKKLINAN